MDSLPPNIYLPKDKSFSPSVVEPREAIILYSMAAHDCYLLLPPRTIIQSPNATELVVRHGFLIYSALEVWALFRIFIVMKGHSDLSSIYLSRVYIQKCVPRAGHMFSFIKTKSRYSHIQLNQVEHMSELQKRARAPK